MKKEDQGRMGINERGPSIMGRLDITTALKGNVENINGQFLTL